MSDQTLNIVEGTEVIDSDGEKLGTVDRIEGQYIVAKKGWFFPSDQYIPESAIESVTDAVITLNVPKDTILNQGWDESPRGTVTDTAYVDDTGRGATAGAVGQATDTPFDHRASDEGAHRDDNDTIRVPLSEEELTATRRGVDRGEVRVEKDVIAEERTLYVPVTEERVNVNRRVVDRDLPAGETAFEGGTIEVPVHGEEVDVQKQSRVREELEITKEAVQETEHVSDTVRREEANVTDTTVDRGTARNDDTNRR